jgi:uncharacterized oxidoreductase
MVGVLIDASSLRRLVEGIFVGAGCSDAESARVADNLVMANLSGHDSHGVWRTHSYVLALRSGRQLADQEATVEVDTGPLAVLEGNFGMGQTLGAQATELGINRAREHGVAVVALRHAGHLGRMGAWAEKAAEAGLISILFTNARGGALVAPFGGAERRFGTNPVTIGVPHDEDPPLILDFATSIVAEGKTNVALQGGPAVPSDALVTGDGVLTGDPVALYGEVRPGMPADPRRGAGALRAMGEHKGSGLAFMCELLGGVLTGSGCSSPRPEQFCNGMLAIFLDPSRFAEPGSFAAEVNEFVTWVKQARAAQGHDEVLVPGEPEQRRRRQREAEGLDLPDGTWASLMAACEEVGLSPGDVDALLAG